jgi:hypothetical protein
VFHHRASIVSLPGIFPVITDHRLRGTGPVSQSADEMGAGLQREGFEPPRVCPGGSPELTEPRAPWPLVRIAPASSCLGGEGRWLQRSAASIQVSTEMGRTRSGIDLERRGEVDRERKRGTDETTCRLPLNAEDTWRPHWYHSAPTAPWSPDRGEGVCRPAGGSAALSSYSYTRTSERDAGSTFGRLGQTRSHAGTSRFAEKQQQKPHEGGRHTTHGECESAICFRLSEWLLSQQRSRADRAVAG